MLNGDRSGPGKWPLRCPYLRQSLTNYPLPWAELGGSGCHWSTETLTVTLLSHLLEWKGNLQGPSWLGCFMPRGSVHILRQACETSCSRTRQFELLFPGEGTSPHRCHLLGWHSQPDPPSGHTDHPQASDNGTEMSRMQGGIWALVSLCAKWESGAEGLSDSGSDSWIPKFSFLTFLPHPLP